MYDQRGHMIFFSQLLYDRLLPISYLLRMFDAVDMTTPSKAISTIYVLLLFLDSDILWPFFSFPFLFP